jgi:hypothetical protein
MHEGDRVVFDKVLRLLGVSSRTGATAPVGRRGHLHRTPRNRRIKDMDGDACRCWVGQGGGLSASGRSFSRQQSCVLRPEAVDPFIGKGVVLSGGGDVDRGRRRSPKGFRDRD